ncbi:hypothetical protein EG329_009294 [Mollisiaceae sp. DMI_Dod_QoI]|nr:hypothetical protein EG329_009294 [Helotiales sp. DMI_Dod_QoI]
MRRIARLERSIDLAKTRTSAKISSTYLCSACRNQATPFSTSTLRAARVPYTEKIRQKIWGTDQPLGQKDPYGEGSVLDQTKKREKEEELKERDERRAAAQPSPPDMSTYEQSTTWGNREDGRIPWVGGFGYWWKKNWDPQNQFSGFVPNQKSVMSAPDQITAAFYRALVEVYACKQAGLSLTASAGATKWNPKHKVQIRSTATGVELDFSAATKAPSLDAFTQFLQSSSTVDETAVHEAPTESEEDVAADRSTLDPLHPESVEAPVDETAIHENPTESEEDVAADRSPFNPLLNKQRSLSYEAFVKSCDPSWRQVSLEDPEIKFAVLKRVLRITGIRIPDSAIQPSKTAGAFLSQLIKPPKPRKLAEALQPQLLSLQNVKFSGTRVTPIDKEKQVGRWKLVEQELRHRGLPVTGH